jgi:hypothetical protein
MIAVAASACSTGALHFLLSPYINNIYLLTNNEEKTTITPNTQIAIETLDLLTRKRTTVLRLRDLSPISGSSFLTWKVNKSILEKQYALEQAKGIEPKIVQTKFWLDQTNGTGDRDTMINILRLVHEQGRQRSL